MYATKDKMPRKLLRGWRLPAALGGLVLVLLVIKLFIPFPSLVGLSQPGPTPSAPPSPRPTVYVPPLPDWVTEKVLTVNEYSRPGTLLDAVNGVVVHYVGNPKTTAAQNRSYFNSLAQTHDTYASSNFIVGLDGEVLLCVPMNEVAYCSNDRNFDTISIEVCHPDSTGAFTPESYQSLLKLVQWLADTYHLDREQILRHYDVIGKECPLYYVRNPEAWTTFLDELDFGTPDSQPQLPQ